MRDDWHTYFMEIAKLVSTRSTCLRRKVGAIAVHNNRILATGYNGAPSGMAHCEEIGCLRTVLKIPSGERHEMCRAIHAEQNLIIQAALTGTVIEGADIYCTTQPCSICAKMLVGCKIHLVYVSGVYPDSLSKEILGQKLIYI